MFVRYLEGCLAGCSRGCLHELFAWVDELISWLATRLSAHFKLAGFI